MKAKVIETGEIIDVKCLRSVIYSRLDGNGKIFEEYYEDELEFPEQKKMVSVDRVVKWLRDQEEMLGVSFQEDFYERLKAEL